MKQLFELVDEQAEDEGLWFEAATAPEAYLQQELRSLHAAAENAKPEYERLVDLLKRAGEALTPCPLQDTIRNETGYWDASGS